MKQRITIEQLNELNDVQKNALREWWKPDQYDVIWDGECTGVMEYWESTDSFSYGPRLTPRAECLPVMSIGQCIQLLSDFEVKAEVTTNQNEPIDVLWDAVKTALEG